MESTQIKSGCGIEHGESLQPASARTPECTEQKQADAAASFTAIERLPEAEIRLRQQCCLRQLAEASPEAGGLLVQGRTNVYYLTGTLAAGLLWLPQEGEPVLLVRKGLERARLESPLAQIVRFKSFKELPAIAEDAGSPLPKTLGVDKEGFSWTMAEMLASRLGETAFVDASLAIARARMVKTPLEQDRMRACGVIHAKVFDEILPARLRPGMTERELALCFVEESMRLGSDGLSRSRALGEEMHYGYASCGTSGLYPTCYPGPLGCRGSHPAVPFLGSSDVVWQEATPLAMDMGCSAAGYNTDRTQVYWAGKASGIPDSVRRAHEACIEILERALERLRPGAIPAEIWLDAKAQAKRLGYAEGFMGLGEDQLAFLGHGIGLNLDERPALARGFAAPLEAGMCLAVEPKIGLPGLGMIGLEHTYLVREGSPEPLTGTARDMIAIG
ncbi:MAG: aminopeptidase P family protein [Desulfovibrio sp.]|nr:aminopeptidase P family protein [Desulfovibrio sp.]